MRWNIKLSNIVCLLVIFSGILFIYLFSGKTCFDYNLKKAEKEVAHIYKSLDAVSAYKDLNINHLSIDSFREIQKSLPFDLFVYENDKLIFWNENKAIPDLNIANLSDTAQQISLKNGYYIALKKTIGNTDFVALSLLRYSYNLVNKYLTNSFSKQFRFQDSDIILPSELNKGEVVRDPNGNVIFRIQQNKENQDIIDPLKLFISLLILICFFVLSKNVYQIGLKKDQFIQGLSLLFLMAVMFFFTLKIVPFEFNKWVIFSPTLYGSRVFESLGFMFLTSVYTLGICYVIFIHTINNRKPINRLVSFLFVLISITLIVLLSTNLRTLVLDSVINFGSKNLTLFNPYAVFGLLVALISCLIFLVMQIAFLSTIRKSRFKIPLLVGLSIVVVLLLLLLGFETIAIGVGFLYFLYSAITIVLLDLNHNNKVLQIIFVSLFFAIIQSSSIIREFTIQKQEGFKKTFAFKKSRQRDVEAEDQFGKIAFKIQDDELIKKFFKFPMITYKDINKRMNFLYFGGYFSKYNVSITPFNIDGIAIKTIHKKRISTIKDEIEKFGTQTLDNDLIFIEDETQQNSYLSLLEIEDNGIQVGTLLIKLTPKTYDIGNVYPELLLQGKKDIIEQYYDDYEFAIYANNRLIRQNNEFPYVSNISQISKTEYAKEGYQHHIFQVEDQKKIIVSSKTENLLDSISVFSFVLCLYMILGFLIVLFYFSVLAKEYQKYFNFSFRKRITIAMLIIVILSFFVIGLATVSFFSEQYNSYHKKRLIRKQKSISFSLKHIMDKNNLTSADKFYKYFLNSNHIDLNDLSNIHKMDLNLFNTNGQLLKSSQDGIFSSGLLSNIMSSEAYVLLNNEKQSLVVQEEHIGNLKYLSAYIPLVDIDGENMAYLNVPYFAKEKNLNQDISNFMISLINVYVLLLIIASIIAFFLSNSMTNPLKVISNKLKDIKLTQKNETIYWKQDDEIGALVKEYNRMIWQLEQNAKLLAKSERDSAWREMAKQIAHEIKNPLTPMKLSIQHLQRAIKNDKDKGADLAIKVSNTLIEQINNLSGIATAFSTYAKMPKGNKTEVDLVEVIQLAVNLFINDEIQFTTQYEIENPKILGDKNQMISVFNNLIKNAIEATQENENRIIILSLKSESNNFIVSIQDNGVGVNAEQSHKLFVPNFTTKSSGTGLGLAITKQIVESVDGEIWFESEYQKGTTFFVKIPQYIQN